MSKKKINIVLLAIVLGLWGTVIYKYISHFFFSPQLENYRSSNNVSSKLINSVKDTFELKPLERDPFLALSYYEPKPKVKHSSSSSTKINVQKKKPISRVKRPFPRIIYYGHILSEEKKKEMILLSIGGKFLKLHLNDEIENIKVIGFTRDSIKVLFEKESQWIRLKK